jgi:hypothetical protein
MLYRTRFAVGFKINTKHIDAVWAERTVLERETGWCFK